MLSSETCMLASQESLSNKRVCNEYDVEAISVNSHVCNLHMESVAKKSCLCNDNFASISNIEQSFASSLKLLWHTSAENVYGDDEAFINHSSDDVSVTYVLQRDSDCSNNNAKPSSTKSISNRSIESINVLPIEGNRFNWAFTPEELICAMYHVKNSMHHLILLIK